MKKLMIAIFALFPLFANAQTVKTLTPEEQLEQAQKQLEEAQKAVATAKANAEKAKQAAAEAKAKAEAQAKAKEIAAKQAAIEEQIRKAKEEAARLNAEAERLNAEAGKVAETPKKEAEAAKPVPSQPATKVTYTNTDGWTAPAVPAAEKRVANNKVTKTEDLSGYMAGAVPVTDGKVAFTLDLNVPGKSAQEIYDIAYQYLGSLTTDENQREDESQKSTIALVNPNSHVIAARMCEWLVFTQNFLSLDRCKFNHILIATCTDQHINLTMERMNYNYEEHRSTGFKATAENVITDELSLNKSKTKLNKIYGKFRKATIDRKNQIFAGLEAALK